MRRPDLVTRQLELYFTGGLHRVFLSSVLDYIPPVSHKWIYNFIELGLTIIAQTSISMTTYPL